LKRIEPNQIGAWLDHMAQTLQSNLADCPDTVYMVGIHTGGFRIARELHRRIGLQTPLGGLNISFYRDDFSARGLRPQSQPSDLPTSLDGCGVVLVDDVLYTGRTARAALNELFDYGRPLWVKLAVLVDRGGRELPITADVTGRYMELQAEDRIKLSGPEPLQMDIINLGNP